MEQEWTHPQNKSCRPRGFNVNPKITSAFISYILKLEPGGPLSGQQVRGHRL